MTYVRVSANRGLYKDRGQRSRLLRRISTQPKLGVQACHCASTLDGCSWQSLRYAQGSALQQKSVSYLVFESMAAWLQVTEEVRTMFQYIQDADLWQWRLPDSRAFSAGAPVRRDPVPSSEAACQASHASALPAALSGTGLACLGPLSSHVITSAAVCRDVLPLDGAVLQPARMLISSRAGSVQHISCVHTRAKRAAGGLTTEACRSRCIAARVRCGKSPSIFDTLLGLRIPQLVDQVCYDAGLP
jgi:hypothetical protein